MRIEKRTKAMFAKGQGEGGRGFPSLLPPFNAVDKKARICAVFQGIVHRYSNYCALVDGTYSHRRSEQAFFGEKFVLTIRDTQYFQFRYTLLSILVCFSGFRLTEPRDLTVVCIVSQSSEHGNETGARYSGVICFDALRIQS